MASICENRQVLILVDGSDFAQESVEWFASTSLLSSDHVELLHVLPSSDSICLSNNQGHRGICDPSLLTQFKYDELFSKPLHTLMTKGLKHDQITTNLLCCPGSSRGALTCALDRYLRDKRVDLIVLGRKGTGFKPTEKKGLGGFSEFLLDHYSKDVPLIFDQGFSSLDSTLLHGI